MATRKLSNEKIIPGIDRLAADKHVMSPDQKTEHRDRHAGTGDQAVTEDSFARETGDQFADHTHAGQNHDVNRRMRVEPEEMLEEKRIAAQVSDRKCQCPKNARAT